MKAMQVSESQMQREIFNVLGVNRRAYPFLQWIYAESNGSDNELLCCPFPSFQNMGVSHGAYIELKAGKNKPTAEQMEFLQFVNANGYSTAVVYSADDALDFIENYCGIKLIR